MKNRYFNFVLLLIIGCSFTFGRTKNIDAGPVYQKVISGCELYNSDGSTYTLYKDSWLQCSHDTLFLHYSDGKDIKLSYKLFSDEKPPYRISSIDSATISLDKTELYSSDSVLIDYKYTIKIKTVNSDSLYSIKIPGVGTFDNLKGDTSFCVKNLTDSCNIKGLVLMPSDCFPVYYNDISVSNTEQQYQSPSFIERYWWVLLIVAILFITGAAVGTIIFIRKKNAKYRYDREENEEHEEQDRRDAYPYNSNIKREDEQNGEDDDAYRDKIDSLNKKITELQSLLEQKKSDCKNEKENLNTRHENEISKITAKFESEIKELEEKLKSEKQKVNTIRQEVTDEYSAKIKKLDDEVSVLKSDKNDLSKQLRDTTLSLNDTTNKLESANSEIDSLKVAQKQYTEKVLFVDFASDYAMQILELMNIVNDIRRSSESLLLSNAEDKYLIYKAKSTFDSNMLSVNMNNFTSDVRMAAEKQITFSDSGIANLSSVDKSKQPRSLRQYFLTAYLEKYINAAVVFNESLIGLDRLISGVTKKDVEPFINFRHQLEDCCGRLGITILSAKLFDTVGNNVELKAEMIDFDESLPADTILEISNCLVYLSDSERPSDKIYVKAQK